MFPRIKATAVALLAVVVAGGCGGAAPAPPPTAVTSGFNGTDTAWVQLMISMDERLLPVLGLAGGSREIQTFARQMGVTVRADLTTLRELRARAGLAATDPHQGHTMPGMVSTEGLAALKAARGAAFRARSGRAGPPALRPGRSCRRPSAP